LSSESVLQPAFGETVAKPVSGASVSPPEINHDGLFKELLSRFFFEFIDLFFPQMFNYLDRDAGFEMLDKELIGEILQYGENDRREADVVMKVQFKDPPPPAIPVKRKRGRPRKFVPGPGYFLVHIEHQSQSETDFEQRMFFYFVRLMMKYPKMPIRPIALFSFDTPKTPQLSQFVVAFEDKEVLKFNYDVVQLNQLRWRSYLKQENPVAGALMSKMNVDPKDHRKVKAACLRLVLGLPPRRDDKRFLYYFVSSYLPLTPQEDVEIAQELNLSPEKKEVVMEFMTDLELYGLQRGLEQGRAEGRAEQSMSTSIRQLRRKFGERFTSEHEERVRKLELAQLNSLAEDLLDFAELSDLEVWLRNNEALPAVK
jgi:hypothetical protein